MINIFSYLLISTGKLLIMVFNASIVFDMSPLCFQMHTRLFNTIRFAEFVLKILSYSLLASSNLPANSKRIPTSRITLALLGNFFVIKSRIASALSWSPRSNAAKSSYFQ